MGYRALQAPRCRQRGFSLVELMIALTIGMVVMGAVFVAYVAATQSTRHSRAIAQMTEDATSALAVLRANLAMAGFSRPVGFSANGQRFKLLLSEPYLAGCQGSAFDDTAAAIGALAAACPANSASQPDSVAVAYEANAGNSAMSVGTPARPLDCLGNAVQNIPAAGGLPTYDLAYSRFYLDGTNLMCRGNVNNPAQPLAENVKDLQIQYGVQSDVKKWVVYYTDAAKVTDGGLWDRVGSVRICVVMQSDSDNVVDATTPYTGCFPANYSDTVTPDDKRAYRAFTTTIALNNRLPLDAPSP